ncbi:DEAD-box ATP-dependent RNA helicase CshA [subsurface metagenome]
MKFEDFNLTSETMDALKTMGMHTPTDIQQRAIPEILEKEKTHILAQARTGTGKTLAYSIPIAEKIDPSLRSVQSVILVPTRELCKQVYEVISELTKYRRLKAVEVYGGVSINRQISIIRSGAQIVIATPGRLIDLYERRALNFKNVKIVVLDEADRMLDMGFLPDVEFILFKAMKEIFPTLLLFSATMLKEIKDIAVDFSWGQELLEINVSHDNLTVTSCKQYYYKVANSKEKYNKFVKILIRENPTSCIIFVNTKRWGANLKRRLIKDKRIRLRLDTLQGDMTQKQREIVMRDFRNKKINCLIATNVAARGLDIPHVTHIFNYDLPEGDPEVYVHRIGRTSRMEGKGRAISLVESDQMPLVRKIELFMDRDIEQMYLSQQERNEDRSQNRYSQGYGRREKFEETEKHEDEVPGAIADVSVYSRK